MQKVTPSCNITMIRIHISQAQKSRPNNPNKTPHFNAIMVQTQNTTTSHLTERIARGATTFLGPELGLVVLDLWLLLLRLGSGHEANLAFTDDGVLAHRSLLGLHVLRARAE